MDNGTITIDKAGRVVLPKAVRERLGIRPGSSVCFRLRENHLELFAADEEPVLVKRNGWWLHRGGSEEDLTSAVREHRENRLKKLSS